MGQESNDKYKNNLVITREYLEEIAKLCVVPGKSYKQVGLDLGKSESYISNLRRDYPELVEMTDNLMRQRFKELAVEATAQIANLMHGAESETVRLNAAKEIVSKAGYDAVQKVENTNKEITIELIKDED